jgi:hypothetical protein
VPERRVLLDDLTAHYPKATLLVVDDGSLDGTADAASTFVGAAYSLSVLLLAVIVVGFLLAMHYSISLSRLGGSEQAPGPGDRSAEATSGERSSSRDGEHRRRPTAACVGALRVS